MSNWNSIRIIEYYPESTFTRQKGSLFTGTNKLRFLSINNREREESPYIIIKLVIPGKTIHNIGQNHDVARKFSDKYLILPYSPPTPFNSQ